MQVESVYLQPFWRNLHLKYVSQHKIVEKLTKTKNILGVKGHLRLSMLTFLRRSSAVLVVISKNLLLFELDLREFGIK